MMEEKRKTLGVVSPSRLNRLFTFKKEFADNFGTGIKFF